MHVSGVTWSNLTSINRLIHTIASHLNLWYFHVTSWGTSSLVTVWLFNSYKMATGSYMLTNYMDFHTCNYVAVIYQLYFLEIKHQHWQCIITYHKFLKSCALLQLVTIFCHYQHLATYVSYHLLQLQCTYIYTQYYPW